MSMLQMVLVGMVVVLLVAWGWMRFAARSGPVPVRRKPDRIDTIIGWPPLPTRVLSNSEMRAMATLVRALPEFLILAQVPLARFLNVPKRNSYADWLRRVGYQSVDFLVCDIAAQVVAAIELVPPQLSDRARKRHERIERTLTAAHIPLHTWHDNLIPTPEQARDALLPRLGPTAMVAPVQAPPPSSRPVPFNPFEQPDRDSSHDETIEMEPPPPTWYDDLDSDPAPLGKR